MCRGSKNKPHHQCTKCKENVNDSQNSIACNFCDEYTHLTCDKALPKALFDLLCKHPENSLVYLCMQCKPLISPINRPTTVATNVAKSIEDTCKTKLKDIRDEQNKALDFLVSKTNKLDQAVQSLKQMVVDLNKINIQGVTSSPGPRPGHPDISWAAVAGNQPENTSSYQTASADSNRAANPKASHDMVIYNVPYTLNETTATLQLAGICRINKHHITSISRLSSAKGTPPVLVELNNERSKWLFIKAINSQKPYGTYSRPYLTGLELKVDNALVNELKKLRDENPSRKYKIYRRAIVEDIGDVDNYIVMITAQEIQNAL